MLRWMMWVAAKSSPVFRQVTKSIEGSKENELKKYLKHFSALDVPEKDFPALRNKLEVLALHEVWGTVLVFAYLFLALVVVISSLFAAVPLWTHAVDKSIALSTSFILGYLVSVAALFITLAMPFLLIVTKKEIEIDLGLPSLFWPFIIWPAFVLSQVLPSTALLKGLTSVRLFDVSQFTVFGYTYGETVTVAAIAVALIWFSLLVLIGLASSIETCREGRKRRRHPEKFILVSLASTICKLNSIGFGYAIVYGSWPESRLRRAVGVELEEVIYVLEHWMPHTISPDRGHTKAWIEDEFLCIAEYFRAAQRVVLLPETDSLTRATKKLVSGFNNLYLGRWAEIKCDIEQPVQPSPRRWLPLLRSMLTFLGILSVGVFLTRLPGVFEVLDSDTIKTLRFAAILLAFLYVVQWADPTFAARAVKILKGFSGANKPSN